MRRTSATATAPTAGRALSHMLVKVLTGVFDPPLAALAVPWSYLGAVAGVALAATSAAGAVRATGPPAMALIPNL